MRKIKIFLASSNELKAEREQFEIEINRKNKAWNNNGIFLYLNIWEDLSARVMPNGSQNKYNEFVKSADLFVLLAATKVGMYTSEEFDTAFGQFRSTNRPFIFTYFKIIKDTIEPSLSDFQQHLDELKHFYSHFIDSNDLWNQFNKELERLELVGFVKNEFKRSITINNQKATIDKQYISSIISHIAINYEKKQIDKYLGLRAFHIDRFIGREDDLIAINQKLFDENNILLLVNGEGGIGKTTLAAKTQAKWL